MANDRDLSARAEKPEAPNLDPRLAKTQVWKPYAIIAAIFLTTLLAYLPALSSGFIWDDDDYVTENGALRSPAGLWAIWSDPSATPQYYPIVHTTFWLEYQTYQLNAAGYHLVNILLHCVVASLAYLIGRRLAIPGSWLIAWVFALHPVHVESVAWITERKNVLSAVFYLLAAWSYLRYAGVIRAAQHDPGRRGRWLAYLGSMMFFVAALLSKTVTASLPAALLLILYWKRGSLSRRDLLSVAPLMIIGAGFGLMTAYLEKVQVGADGIDWDLEWSQRLVIAGRAIWFYAGKLVAPVELIFTYPRWQIPAGLSLQWLWPITAAAVLVGFWFARRRIGRGPFVAVAFFCGTLFPALGFIDVYPMRFSFVADHFQYLASLGVITLVVTAMLRLTNHLSSDSDQGVLVKGILVSCVLLLMTVLTWKQTLIYRDLETLWRETLAANPTSWMAHNNLGSILNRRGDYVEAEEHLRESIRLKPNFADSVNNLGKAREGQGDVDSAIELYSQASSLKPTDPQIWANLGAMLGATGKLEGSKTVLRKALELDPRNATALTNMGTLAAMDGDTVSAIEYYQVSLKSDPSNVDTRLNLSQMYIQSERNDDAIEVLRWILDRDPNQPRALLKLGTLYAMEGKFETAAGLFELLLKIEPGNQPAMQNLAYCYSNLGREVAGSR